MVFSLFFLEIILKIIRIAHELVSPCKILSFARAVFIDSIKFIYKLIIFELLSGRITEVNVILDHFLFIIIIICLSSTDLYYCKTKSYYYEIAIMR